MKRRWSRKMKAHQEKANLRVGFFLQKAN